MVEIEKNVSVVLSGDEVAKTLELDDIAHFVSALATRLNGDFVRRNEAASDFASGLSEDGCRFLAEVVTQHFYRNGR